MRQEIENWINKYSSTVGSGTHFIDTLDDEDGQPCLRTYAVHILKGKKPETKEVVREYFDGDIKIHGDLYFIGAAGYKVNWGHSHSYYIPRDCDDNWYLVDLKQRPGMSSWRTFTQDDINRIFKKYVPYFQMKDDLNIMEYARRYKEYASAEQLAKAGFEYLVLDKRVLKLSKQSKKKLVSWLLNPINAESVKTHKPIYNHIAKAVKRGWTMEQFYYEDTIDHYEEEFKKRNFKRTREDCEEVYRYLNGIGKRPVQKLGLHDYLDYLEIAKELRFNMRLKSTLFPLDLKRAHDSLASTKKSKETEEINKKLSQIADILKGLDFSKKDLKIVIPKTQNDFIEWGKKLHICVGTYGYDKKMAKGNCIILMVYLNDQPLECCELTKKERGKNLQIEQLRGEHNQDSPRHKECEELVNKFIHNYQNQQRIGACV